MPEKRKPGTRPGFFTSGIAQAWIDSRPSLDRVTHRSARRRISAQLPTELGAMTLRPGRSTLRRSVARHSGARIVESNASSFKVASPTDAT